MSDNVELLITMTLEGTTNSAVLVLKLPNKTDKKTLSFKDPFYLIKYPKEGTVKELNFDKDIIFSKSTESNKVKITLNGKFI